MTNVKSKFVPGTTRPYNKIWSDSDPTRPYARKQILDLHFTNNSGLVPGILDLDMIVVDSTIKPVIQKKPPRKIFQYSKANWDKAKEDACTFNENFLASDWKDWSVDQNRTLFRDSARDLQIILHTICFQSIHDMI